MELRPEEISNIIKEQITHYQSQIKLTEEVYKRQWCASTA